MENLYNKFYMMYGSSVMDVINQDIEYILQVPQVIDEKFISEFINKINSKIKEEETKEKIKPHLDSLEKLLIQFIHASSNQIKSLHTSIINKKLDIIYILRTNPH